MRKFVTTLVWLVSSSLSLTAYAQSPVQQRDLRNEILAYRIDSGNWQGGYKVNRGDTRMNYYFAALGLQAFASNPAYADQTEGFLDCYLRNADTNTGLIDDAKDYRLKADDPNSRMMSDSDDGYAGMLLLLVGEYYQTPRGKAWWKTNGGRVKKIATQVLLNNQLPSGLVACYSKSRNFVDAAKYPELNGIHGNEWARKFKQDLQSHTYLMDSCEVWAGLKALALVLQAEKDTRAMQFQNAAASVSRGILSLYDAKAQAFYCSDLDQEQLKKKYKDRPSQFYDATEIRFYPHRTAQVWPQYFGVPLGDAKTTQTRYDAGWKFLNGGMPDGFNWATDLAADGSMGGYPWLAIGYLAVLRGDDELAKIQLDWCLAEIEKEEKEEKQNAAAKAKRRLRVQYYFRWIQELGPASRIQQHLARKQ